MTEFLSALPTLSNEQLILVGIGAAVAAFVLVQLVRLVRIVLNREVIDQDPQLAEVIERLDRLVLIGEATYAGPIRERDNQLATRVATIARVLEHWHSTAVLPVALDAVADQRADDPYRRGTPARLADQPRDSIDPAVARALDAEGSR